MSRSVGLREDQQTGERLARRIGGLFVRELGGGFREQARALRRSGQAHTGDNPLGFSPAVELSAAMPAG